MMDNEAAMAKVMDLFVPTREKGEQLNTRYLNILISLYNIAHWEKQHPDQPIIENIIEYWSRVE